MSVRVGVVGTGWVAQDRHIPAFRSHPDAEIVAVHDRQLERARAVAAAFRIDRATADLEEFLDQQLDVVSIATPPWTHAELARMALARRAHVFTEKPMAMSLAEAEGMYEASRASGRLLCVSHNFVFSRAVAKARAFLGPRPEPMYALGVQLSSFRRRLPTWYADLPGGLLFDEVPHLVYLMQHFLGALEVEHVRALPGPGSERRVVEILLAGELAPGQITMVFDAPVSEWQMAVTDRRGVVALDLFRDIAVRIGPDGAHRPLDILRTSVRGLVDHSSGFVSSGVRFAGGRLSWGHDALIHRFVDATLGRRPPPVSADEALGVVRVLDRIVEGLSEEAGAR